MNRSAATPILPVSFLNGRHPTLGIESLRLSELSARVPPGHFASMQRPDFHLLITFTGGCAEHYLDFTRVNCVPGTLLHVRPGQVQQFGFAQGAEAHIILFTSEFVPAERFAKDALNADNLLDIVLPGGVICLDSSAADRVSASFAAIADEYQRADASLLSARILQHLLSVLLLRIVRVSSGNEWPSSGDRHLRTFRRFHRLVDRRFAETRTVSDYAAALGCSEKTLARVCHACRGIAPKEFITHRVVLEAKRLLAHTQSPIDHVAADVGFSQTSNFVKFFRASARMTPLNFRAGFPGHSPGGRRRLTAPERD